ncbi:hypothetical protein [Niabella aurantiaca]|uniref:hypothetical protein n=1 Tax=Niabella aurantiaca TaxID=379900 RepID=UPI00037C3158|nr:hypothetical protein [Niabella aurantiaca]
MKKLIWIIAAFITLNVAAADTNPVLNEKVLKSFELVFAHAEQVKWKQEKDNNEASFKVNDMLVRAVFDDNGKLIRTIRYYREEQLPAIIRYRLKKKFEKQHIANVSELSINDEVTYYVTLKDEQYLVNAVVNGNGQIVTSKKYRRGDL